MDNKNLSDTQQIYQFFSHQEDIEIQNYIFEKNFFHKNNKEEIKGKKQKKISKSRRRIPGHYPDIYSLKKEENNIFILHACKLLQAFYNGEGINALILDGKEIRTTKTLLNLKDKLKKLIIVEYNKDTFSEILEKIKIYQNIKCFRGLINDYLENKNDPSTNLVYFDLMENFFSSETSKGSDYAINYFLSNSKVNEIIFAATFCLRTNNSNMNFETQVEKILLGLELIFKGNLFKFKFLVKKQDMRYKGQRGLNKALMFVLCFLEKDNNNDNNDNNEENNYNLFN